MAGESFKEIMSNDGADAPSRETREPSRKIGEGHLAAMVRAGFKEATNALVAFPDSIKPVEEPGLFGNPTQPMVTQQMGGLVEVTREASLKEILNAPTPPMTPTVERDLGREM